MSDSAPRVCQEPYCGRKHVARGWCDMHYRRWRNGVPFGKRMRLLVAPETCVVPGCDSSNVVGRGMCPSHHRRELLYGSPHGGRSWDRSSYGAIHRRLTRSLGRAKAKTCPCGRPAVAWAYDHADPNEIIVDWEGRPTPVSLKLAHYQALCGSCHRALDQPKKEAS